MSGGQVKRNGQVPMNLPSGARAFGPQRVESAADERTSGVVSGSRRCGLKARGPSEQSAGSSAMSRSKRNGQVPMNLPSGARAFGPQRMESAAHERTIRRGLRLAPLRAAAESPRSVYAVRKFMPRERVRKERGHPIKQAGKGAPLTLPSLNPAAQVKTGSRSRAFDAFVGGGA